MQLSGSMTRKFGPSWKQSTGHTSTQSVCLQLMQFSVTTWVMGATRVFQCGARMAERAMTQVKTR
jgi:hypothetical protein